MKKFLSLLLTAALTVGCFTACGSGSGGIAEDDGRINIISTVFPGYDWVNDILGDNPADADVSMLIDNGVDLHSYQPSAADILKISTCDMFIYVGGESDAWVEDALSNAMNKDMVVVNLLDVVGDAAKEEETVEGMQEEEQVEEGDEDEAEYDEHVWLSLRNAKVLVEAISEAIQTLDDSNASVYKNNADEYIAELEDLDESYREAVESGKTRTLLFGDRFPFRYMVDDYGLDYYAAFAGCSAETEATFETITFLSGKMDELGLGAVMTIEGSDNKLAETIIQNTKDHNQKILMLNSMQAITGDDVRNGTTYLSVMRDNLATLKEALDQK